MLASINRCKQNLACVFLAARLFLPTDAATAQEATTALAHVEAVSGRVVALAGGPPVLLNALDVINDQTRVDLLSNSELRVCHYRTQRVLTLRGPARATISADGIIKAGKPVSVSTETCAIPALSPFTGGLLTRGH